MGPADCPEELQYPSVEERQNRQYDQDMDAKIASGEIENPGYRVYKVLPVRKEHKHYEFRNPKLPPCQYKYKYGTCKILTIQYNNTENDAMEVYIAFSPWLRRARDPGERLFRMLFRDDWPTQKYIEKHSIFPGTETTCIHKTLLVGEECYYEDWLLP